MSEEFIAKGGNLDTVQASWATLSKGIDANKAKIEETLATVDPVELKSAQQELDVRALCMEQAASIGELAEVIGKHTAEHGVAPEENREAREGG